MPRPKFGVRHMEVDSGKQPVQLFSIDSGVDQTLYDIENGFTSWVLLQANKTDVQLTFFNWVKLLKSVNGHF